MNLCWRRLSLLLVLWVSATGMALAQGYDFSVELLSTPFASADANFTRNGWLTGVYRVGSLDQFGHGYYQGFLRSPSGTITLLPGLGGDTTPAGISPNGQVAGMTTSDTDGHTSLAHFGQFIWQPNTVRTTLQAPLGQKSGLRTSDFGVVITAPNGTARTYSWDGSLQRTILNGSPFLAATMDDAGNVIGRTSALSTEWIVFHPDGSSSTQPLPAGFFPLGLSSQGEILASWREHILTGDPQYDFTVAPFGVNSLSFISPTGSVINLERPAGLLGDMFVSGWQPGLVVGGLNSPPLSSLFYPSAQGFWVNQSFYPFFGHLEGVPAGVFFLTAGNVDKDGTVAATFIDSLGSHIPALLHPNQELSQALLAARVAIPEPAALGLLCLGLPFFWLLYRCRRSLR